MTLDDAIKHCQQVADESDCECADEHRQLAEWLKELKKFKQKQTNEEWFDGLSTLEKAKWLEDKMTWAAQEQGTYTSKGWLKWLKEKHND